MDVSMALASQLDRFSRRFAKRIPRRENWVQFVAEWDDAPDGIYGERGRPSELRVWISGENPSLDHVTFDSPTCGTRCTVEFRRAGSRPCLGTTTRAEFPLYGAPDMTLLDAIRTCESLDATSIVLAERLAEMPLPCPVVEC